MEKFDPVTNTWTEVASLLQKRLQPIAGVCNGKIYVFGVKNPEGNLVETYDMQDKMWKKITCLPTKIGKNYIHQHLFIFPTVI